MKSLILVFVSLIVFTSCQKKDDGVAQQDCAQTSVGSTTCIEKHQTFNLEEPTEKFDLELWQFIDGITVKTANVDFLNGIANYNYVDLQGVAHTKTIQLSSAQLNYVQAHLRRMTFCHGPVTNTLSHLDACFASPIRLKLEMQSDQVLEIEYGGTYNFCDNYAGVSELARSLSLFLISSSQF